MSRKFSDGKVSMNEASKNNIIVSSPLVEAPLPPEETLNQVAVTLNQTETEEEKKEEKEEEPSVKLPSETLKDAEDIKQKKRGEVSI